MASNREERRLQRLRGAQSHQVGDLDFGIQIPTTAAPRPALPQLPSSRRTPAGRSRDRPASASPARIRTTPPPPLSTRSNNANISVKRRKLDEPSETQIPSSSSRSTRSRGKRNVYDIDDEEEDARAQEQRTPEQILETVDELAGEERPVMQTPVVRSGRGEPTPSHIDEEITESPRGAPGSGQRRRLGQSQAQALSSVLQEAVADVTPIPLVRKKGIRDEVLQSASHAEPLQRRSRRNTQTSSAVDDQDELSPELPNKHLHAERFSDVEEEEQEEAEAIDDVEAATRLRRKRKRKSPELLAEEAEPLVEKPVNELADPDPEEDDELAERQIKAVKRKRGRPKSSPESQRQPKKSKEGGPLGKSKSRNGIPIAVHRLTNPIIYGEDNTDVDILHAEILYAKRGGVNAVDVLAQVCEEVLGSLLGILENGGSRAQDSKTRREYRTKLRAVEAFQEELRVVLFELTTMLDAEYALSKRVRDAQKEKIHGRQELLRIRAEREQVALRMDEVRIKHESRSEEAQEQHALNTNLQDIELAVSLAIDNELGDREIELAPLDLEVALKMVAGEVSSKSGGGGILRQMRDFNDFLERAALALEGRS